MCGLCPDVLDGCAEIECGALTPVDENGNRRRHYIKWFNLGDVPCRHIREGHRAACPIHEGIPCDYEDECDV